MNRRHSSRRTTGDHYAMLPHEVLVSRVLTTLPHFCLVILAAIADQYRGNNNGDLGMTWGIVKQYGVRSKNQLVEGLALLLGRGLIQKTRQGGKRPLGPTLYALTWRRVDDLKGKIESGATTTAANTWAQWESGPPGGQRVIKQRDRQGTPSAPRRDQRCTLSGPPRDQRPPINGTAGGPPSRVWRVSPDLTVKRGGKP
jgi:hypothetical protein